MSDNKIVIFGASTLGEIAYNRLNKNYQVEYFCDNDESRWGEYFQGVKIISPELLA